jgi:hypothetical protein
MSKYMPPVQLNTTLKDQLDKKFYELQCEAKQHATKKDDALMAQLHHALTFPQRFRAWQN